MVKVRPLAVPSSAPAPPQGAPCGSRQLGTPRARPVHWAPCHRLGCSSEPPPKPPIPPRLTIQVPPSWGRLIPRRSLPRRSKHRRALCYTRLRRAPEEPIVSRRTPKKDPARGVTGEVGAPMEPV
eukprot:scaffold58121_cov74-Phaeocystis_antarctica.AAC.3